MVYCTHCGSKNGADALRCTNCSALLGDPATAPVDDRSLRMRPVFRAGSIIGLAVGLFIVLAGVIWFLQQANLIPRTVELWPFAAVIFGVLLILGAVRGIRYWR